jgi:hypothetical protein
MEEKDRRDWESGKDPKRSWSLVPKQDPLEMLSWKACAPEGVKENK